MKRIIIILIMVNLTVIGFSQQTWDTGEIGFNYGSPFPNEVVAFSGSFLSSEIPAQGVGGFEVSQADTNFLSLVAYDIHVEEGDTLADIFTIIIQDSVEITPGYYVVGVGAGSIKGFIWMQDVDPAVVAGLIDTSFSLDSLSVLNPFISLSGQIEITELNEHTVAGNFAGAMLNTSMDFIIIGDGSFAISNTLPALTYDQGTVEIMADTSVQLIEGELNPLQSERGVGAVETQQADTLTTNLFAYAPQADGSLSIYGLVFRALADDYPAPGGQLAFAVGGEADDLPMALPYVLENASLEQLLQLLGSETLPGIAEFENLYLPAGAGTAVLGYTSDETAFATIPAVLMANATGASFSLVENWSLWSSAPTSIAGQFVYYPDQPDLVGKAFPNPFNSSTVIPFRLNENTQLNLKIHNILGQEAVSLAIGDFPAGSHNYQINMGQFDLAGGLYHFSLNSGIRTIGSGSFIYLK